jgi:N-acetylglutamate synthase-like GNAT family acetyltransferase
MLTITVHDEWRTGGSEVETSSLLQFALMSAYDFFISGLYTISNKISAYFFYSFGFR